ncbi:Hypothetical predicted protein, partial [Olea europaea subsp. europaea]
IPAPSTAISINKPDTKIANTPTIAITTLPLSAPFSTTNGGDGEEKEAEKREEGKGCHRHYDRHVATHPTAISTTTIQSRSYVYDPIHCL